MRGARSTAWSATRSATTEIRGRSAAGVRFTGRARPGDRNRRYRAARPVSASGTTCRTQTRAEMFVRAMTRSAVRRVFRERRQEGRHSPSAASPLTLVRAPSPYAERVFLPLLPDAGHARLGNRLKRAGRDKSFAGWDSLVFGATVPQIRPWKCVRGPCNSRIRARLTAGPRSSRSPSARSGARSARAGRRTTGGIGHPDESKDAPSCNLLRASFGGADAALPWRVSHPSVRCRSSVRRPGALSRAAICLSAVRFITPVFRGQQEIPPARAEGFGVILRPAMRSGIPVESKQQTGRRPRLLLCHWPAARPALSRPFRH
jgi:hypothetical protein